MAHDDVRSLGGNVPEASVEPISNHRRLFGRQLQGRTRPTLDQMTLQLAFARRKIPVTRLATHSVADAGERLGGALGGIRPRGRTKPFVGLLMAIQQVPDQIVLGFVWRSPGPAVVGEREQDRRTCRAAAIGKQMQPGI